MSSIQMTIEERVAALEQSIAEMKQSAVPVKAPKQSKKPKKAEAAEGGSDVAKAAKEPTAWNLMVTATVSEMRQNGWTSWTDLKGVVWPASKPGVTVRVKDKKSGAESDSCVFDGGEHDGKPPSPALGGMVRASYLKSLTDPVAKANAEAYHAKLAERRSNASTGSGAKEEPVADAPEAGKKGGRPKMTEEQKAEAKLKREAKKSAEAAAVVAEEVEMAAEEAFEEVEAEAEAQTPIPEAQAPIPEPPAPAAKSKFPVGLPKLAGSSMERIKADIAKKAAAAKKVDLSFFPWTHKGVEYFTNDRKDLLLAETGEWVGRFDGKEIKPVPGAGPEGPADLEGVGMREE